MSFGCSKSLLPVNWHDLPSGHADLYSLRVLSDSRVEVAGRELPFRPLLLFDDGHELAPNQRSTLLSSLTDRRLHIARWYAERFQALSPHELIGQTEGRDYVLLELEAAARSSGRRFGKGRRFERLLCDVADLRAGRTLGRMSDADTPFTEVLKVDAADRLGEAGPHILETLQTRVSQLANGEARFESLLEGASRHKGYAGAVRWREVEIIIQRQRSKPIQELFDLPLEEERSERDLTGSVREAAELLLSREFDLPYYAGPDAIAKLGSQNIDQFLALCGDLFEEMLASTTLARSPYLSASRQHKIIVESSERMWREIPRRVPHGRDVQRLLAGVLTLAQRETYRPTAPYSPGVTGTALKMRDRQLLLDPQVRESLPGGARLFDALGAAIAFNIFSAEVDRPVKGDRFMVLNINRLLLPRAWLPLGRGGFRDRRLEDLARLLHASPVTADVGEPALGLEL